MAKKLTTSTLKRVFQRNKQSSSSSKEAPIDNQEDAIQNSEKKSISADAVDNDPLSARLSTASKISSSTKAAADVNPTERNCTTNEATASIKMTSAKPLSMSLPVSERQMDIAYETLVPTLPLHNLPRGGVSIQTQACGFIQFGIPPETIKDSMKLGLGVPSVYIVPVDRFCREMGPALGVNLAEFEFPAYFNFFIQRKKCTLVVDSVDAERNIRRVFSETLLGPAQFRLPQNKLSDLQSQDGDDDAQTSSTSSVNDLGIKKYEEEDFAPDFPRDAIPDFYKELQHFRIMPNDEELVLETLLKFRHFESAPDSDFRDNLGCPPPLPLKSSEIDNEVDNSPEDVTYKSAASTKSNAKKATHKSLTYNQIRWIGDVAKIYPSAASEEDIALNKTKRVEIFKMPSGTDYILHDIDENNIIVGKIRFSGNVRVSDEIGVIGLDNEEPQSLSQRQLKIDTDSTASSNSDGYDDDHDRSSRSTSPLSERLLPPTFQPPSFGVTVLGNSHGFDKSGSTSGYVLWINGRGVMIDPPPYSSATLEREGIRPRTIVGIILTHCHADHDAGAFQKVLTGSPVVVITTPTIYKSFIRKYAALSSLSPELLKHSHRYKPAVIGEPLRFQGATFHFIYTLHSIPCIGFRVDWRGRSMVFTGDHFNNPPALEKLVEKGVMSKQRLVDLTNLPIQKTDLLLHEAGAPPIHTPLDVLMKLPDEVKRRLYVVHTSALPEGCDLRVAPTGTAGTIRLDELRPGDGPAYNQMRAQKKRPSIFESDSTSTDVYDDGNPINLSKIDEYGEESELFNPYQNMYAHLEGYPSLPAKPSEPPPVSLRPTSSSDAWFILNLLSAVPFLSSLSYSTTMEVLETARVVAYCCDEVVLAARRRKDYLVVVWEGACIERETNWQGQQAVNDGKAGKAVWYAGDWTGPRVLQPEKRLSGESARSGTHDIVAMSAEGVKVIIVDFNSLDRILKTGSALYRKYQLSQSHQHSCVIPSVISAKSNEVFRKAVKSLKMIELLDSNSALRKLTAVQKRHLQCIVEGPTVYSPGQRLWRAGAAVDKAFIIVAGTVSFVPKRRHGGSAMNEKRGKKSSVRVKKKHETKVVLLAEADDRLSLGESMKSDAVRAVRELHVKHASSDEDVDDFSLPQDNESTSKESNSNPNSRNNSMVGSAEVARLTRGLQKLAEFHEEKAEVDKERRDSESTNASPDVSLHDLCDAITVNDDDKNKEKEALVETNKTLPAKTPTKAHIESTKDRFANKVLCRLSNKRAIASGLIFSRGHFLGDIEKMVEGLLSTADEGEIDVDNKDNVSTQYGFGGIDDALSLDTMTLYELNRGHHTAHSSTLAAGKDGCVVMVFQKASLLPFLDAHPGLLLSLLGTQVVV